MAETIPQYLSTRDLANMTGLSADYFQKKARDGSLPAMRLGDGPKAPYMIERSEFEQWWKSTLRKVEPCQGHSRSAEKSGTGALGTKARSARDRSKQNLKQWRETASQNGLRN